MPKTKRLSKAEKRNLRNIIENEGSLEYTFRHYAGFEELEDAEFHRLRLAFIAAAEALENYIG